MLTGSVADYILRRTDMTRKTEQKKQKINAPPESDECQTEIRSTILRRTSLQFPMGQPDLEALRSVTREWIVPLLVERFLREQGIELRARSESDPCKKKFPAHR